MQLFSNAMTFLLNEKCDCTINKYIVYDPCFILFLIIISRFFVEMKIFRIKTNNNCYVKQCPFKSSIVYFFKL